MFDDVTRGHTLEATMTRSTSTHNGNLKKNSHNLQHYVYHKVEELGYDIQFCWTICEECKKVINKKIIAWNNRDGVTYTKTFI